MPSKLLDYKSATKLDQTYGMEAKVLPLLQQHDELCDLLSQLALEVKQAVAVDRDLDPKVIAGRWHAECIQCNTAQRPADQGQQLRLRLPRRQEMHEMTPDAYVQCMMRSYLWSYPCWRLFFSLLVFACACRHSLMRSIW